MTRTNRAKEHGKSAVKSDRASLQLAVESNPVLNQLAGAMFLPSDMPAKQKFEKVKSALEMLANISPRNEMERMLAIEMIGTHNAQLECLRRAMIEGQHPDVVDTSVKLAARLGDLFVRQMDALDKHRGRGAQKITVEHVNVHSGGKAFVGVVDVHATPDTQDQAQKDSSSPPGLTFNPSEPVPDVASRRERAPSKRPDEDWP